MVCVMNNHSEEYTTYINSDVWRLKCKRLVQLAGFRCQECGRCAIGLEVHHLTYDRLGNEHDRDLQVLCSPCHEKADPIRSVHASTRSWTARVEGWATKKYGDDWDSWKSFEDVSDEFETWLDNRGDAF